MNIINKHNKEKNRSYRNNHASESDLLFNLWHSILRIFRKAGFINSAIRISLTVFLSINIIMPVYSQFIVPDGEPVSVDDKKKEEKPTDDIKNIDIVRGLQTKVVGKNNDQVKLTWLPPKQADYLILARSKEPISTTQKFLNAESVGVIAANITTHIDMNIPDGSYYYAIVSKKAIKKKTIVLYAKDNYTVSPITVQRIEKADSKDNRIVRFIYAKVLEDNSIKLTWKGVPVQGMNYIVYRSNQIIDSVKDIENAERLKVINNGAEFFTDRTMRKTGSYYYAVTTRMPGEIEDRTLVENSNYTSFGISYNNVNLEITRYIKAIRKGNNSVSIEWEDAQDLRAAYRYQIYRSQRPVLKKEHLAGAKRIATVDPEVEYYVDENLSTGRYYYAIVSVNTDNLISSRFIDGKNTQVAPVVISENGMISEEKGFVYFLSKVNESGVQLTWSLSNTTDIEGAKEMQLYRFQKLPSGIRDLTSGELIARLSMDEVSYTDSPESGVYYYAIFVSTSKGLYPGGFKKDINQIGPVTVRKRGGTTIPDDGQKEDDNSRKKEDSSNKKEDGSWEGTIKNRDVEEIEEPYLLYSDKNKKNNSGTEKTQKQNDGNKTNQSSNDFSSGINNQKTEMPDYKIKPTAKDDQSQKNGSDKVSDEKHDAEKNKNNLKENTGGRKKDSIDREQSEKVNKIIRLTYMKRDYNRAVKYLSRYHVISNSAVRSKAVFYLGLSYYHLNEYQKAVKCFVHPDVKKYYGSRSNFWYKKTLKQIR